MQSDLVKRKLFVRPSVCQTRGFDKMEERSVQIFILYKISQHNFLRRRMVGGDDPLNLKFWVKLTPLDRNRRFSVEAP